MVEQVYPSGRRVKNVLDNNGDLSIVQSAKCLDGTPGTGTSCGTQAGLWNYAQHFAYNAAGAVTAMQLGNGRWESTAFNSRLQPTQIALGVTPGATNILKLEFGYGTTENNGNVLSQTITVPTVGQTAGFAATQNYEYDSLNRLKSAEEIISSQTSWKQTFTFDRYGNRNFDEANTTFAGFEKLCASGTELCAELRKILNPSINQSNNRLSSSDDYVFDTSGNTTEDAQGRIFFYDAENKQIEVQDSQQNVIGQYRYDGDGKRIKKIVPSTGEVTIFVYDAGGKLIAEYSTEMSQDPKVSYTTADHLGSPRILTDENGATISRRDFHPFGEEIQTTHRHPDLGYTPDDVRQKFTTYERDEETDLDFAQARTYGYSHGRFTSPDGPLIDQDRISPQSWNLYPRVLNNPMKFVDPTGMWHTDDNGSAVGDYDGECVEEMGACWDEASATWDFGGDKTPVEATWESDFVHSEGIALTELRQSPNSPFGNSPFSSLNADQQGGLACQAPPSPRQAFIGNCLSQEVAKRVNSLNRARDNELKQSIVGAMHPTPLPPFVGGVVGAATGGSIFPSQVTSDDRASTALAIVGMADVRNLGPIGSALNVLGAGAVEGTFNAYGFRNKLAQARQATEEDRSFCEQEANRRGL